ncbi:MAG: response regulator [Bacteroidales bacterium]
MVQVIPAPLTAPHDFGACCALILDPYLGNRRQLRETLRDLGCTGTQDTGNAAEAWKALAQGGFNVLFLDWSGDIDALAFLHMLRGDHSPNRFLPVVVMTAYGSAEDVAAARDRGATEYMLRPFSSEVVASRLRSIVMHPRLYIEGGSFFGPDRRRRHLDWTAAERRLHQNWRGADRRQTPTSDWNGPERRQGRPGFQPLERRDAPRA